MLISILSSSTDTAPERTWNVHHPEEILEDWTQDPERPIFLIDETRCGIFDQHDELVIFNCACLTAKKAYDILSDASIARRTVGEESFKGRDFCRQEVLDHARPLIAIVAGAFRDLIGFYVVATKASGQRRSGRSAKTRIRAVQDETSGMRPIVIEGRELGAVVHLAKIAANALNVWSRQVDVVVDRSDQTGLGATKRRLPQGTMEVLGPAQLNRLAGGGQSKIQCPATFRLIADSDEGPFRDLLLLPDFYGHLLLKGFDAQNRQRLVLSLNKDDYLLLPFTLEAVRASLTNKPGVPPNPPFQPPSGSATCN